MLATASRNKDAPVDYGVRLNQYGLVGLMVLLLVLMAFWNPRFFNARNIGSILRLSAIVGIATIGASFVLLVRGVDITVGAVMGFVSILTAMLLPLMGVVPTIAVVLLTCAAIGLVTGLLVVAGGIPPIVASLGMMWVLRGVSGSITGGRIVRIVNGTFVTLANASLAGLVPYLFIGFIATGLAAGFVLESTRFGRHVYAIGGTEEAAYFSGINVNRVKLLVYVIAAVTYGVGGLFLSSYLRAGMPFTAQGYEFRAITSSALGGIALSGGRGRIGNAVLGAIILTLLYGVVTSLGVSPYLQGMVEGSILIGAVYICQRAQ